MLTAKTEFLWKINIYVRFASERDESYITLCFVIIRCRSGVNWETFQRSFLLSTSPVIIMAFFELVSPYISRQRLSARMNRDYTFKTYVLPGLEIFQTLYVLPLLPPNHIHLISLPHRTPFSFDLLNNYIT